MAPTFNNNLCERGRMVCNILLAHSIIYCCLKFPTLWMCGLHFQINTSGEDSKAGVYWVWPIPLNLNY